MARPGLTNHRKFRRLAKQLGSAITARGVLELIWESCYESGDEYVGTAEDIDHLIGWSGEPGIVAAALVAAGLPEGHGFLEPDAANGAGGPLRFRVHDLWHHAPDYVSNRRAREAERRDPKVCKRCGTTFHNTDPRSEYCSGACRTGGWRDRKGRGTDCDGADRHGDGGGTDRDGSPAPAPAPAPIVPPSEVSAAPHSGTSPAVLSFPTVGKGAKTWELTEAQCADWQEAYPGLDVFGECRKALKWIYANQAKTAKGMPAFLVNWLNRSTNRGGQAPAGAGRAAPIASAWNCRHLEQCGNQTTCAMKDHMPKKYPVTAKERA